MRISAASVLLLFAVSLMAAGCDDDPVTPSGEPTVSGRVTDATGAPVAGASVTLLFAPEGADLPGWEGEAKRPFITTVFFLKQASDVRFEILDYRRDPVKVMLDTQLPAGAHEVRWDATDQNDDPVPPGVYFYRLTSSMFEAVEDHMLLYDIDNESLIDRPHAVTDAQGRYEIPTDIFPIGEMFTVTDEGGSELGEQPISNRVKFNALTRTGGLITAVATFVTVDPDQSLTNVDLQF